LFLGGEFHKGIAQRIARLGITDNLRPCIGIETREDQLQIFIVRNGIELAHEEYVVWRGNVGGGQITKHFQYDGTTLVLLFAEGFLPFLGRYPIVLLGQGDIGTNPSFDAFFRWSLPRR